MILSENVTYLRKHHPGILNAIQIEQQDTGLRIEQARSGAATLVYRTDEGEQYLHSRYNPVQEAETLIQQYKEIADYKHILFYGVGCGYHIEEFRKQYPDKAFSIYEPKLDIFRCFAERIDLNHYKHLNQILVDRSPEDLELNLKKLLDAVQDPIFIIALNSYSKAFAEEFKDFSAKFKHMISEKKVAYQVRYGFAKRWVVNSMFNLPKTAQSPSMIEDKKQYFAGKPVVLVAAGPSLDLEIENLRHIKENGLAYIFSVGTAINALLLHGIEPDATCTYDPSAENFQVFQKLIGDNIKTIPLVFGTNVAHEIIRDYPGPLLSMSTNQDKVSPYYLRRTDGQQQTVLSDATSIAVVTLQLLYHLDCSQVILVGQNLAYRGEVQYSKGADIIEAAKLTRSETDGNVIIPDVLGNDVYTNVHFNRMRFELEHFAANFKPGTLINTTQGGARIEHTVYMPLEELIAKQLQESVVVPEWYLCEQSPYDVQYAKSQYQLMDKAYDELMNTYQRLFQLLQRMQRDTNHRKLRAVEQSFPKFDTLSNQMLENRFFRTFIRSMNQVHLELLFQMMDSIKNERNLIVKANKIVEEFGKFIYNSREDTVLISDVFKLFTAVFENQTEGVEA